MGGAEEGRGPAPLRRSHSRLPIPLIRPRPTWGGSGWEGGQVGVRSLDNRLPPSLTHSGLSLFIWDKGRGWNLPI